MKEKVIKTGIIKGGEKTIYPTNLVVNLREKGITNVELDQLLQNANTLNEVVIAELRKVFSSASPNSDILDITKVSINYIKTTCEEVIDNIKSTKPELFDNIKLTIVADDCRVCMHTNFIDMTDRASIQTVLYNKNDWEMCILHKILE